MSVKNDADRILREVWIQAAAKPEGLRIDCKSINTAKHYRMRLYRVAKPYRDEPGDDPELFDAVQAVSIAQPTSQWLVLQHSASAGLLGEIAAQLKFDPKQEDAEGLKALGERLKERLDKPDTAARVTPYYSREGD